MNNTTLLNCIAAEERICRNRIRRTRQLRRRITFFTTLFLILGGGIFGGSMISRAQEADTDILYKYFTSVPVSEGDSLWLLAKKYTDGSPESKKAFIREVMQTNHMLDDEIRAGDNLIIPYYSSDFKQ